MYFYCEKKYYSDEKGIYTNYFGPFKSLLTAENFMLDYPKISMDDTNEFYLTIISRESLLMNAQNPEKWGFSI